MKSIDNQATVEDLRQIAKVQKGENMVWLVCVCKKS